MKRILPLLLLLAACPSRPPMPNRPPPAWSSNQSFWIDPEADHTAGLGGMTDELRKSLTSRLMVDGFQPGSPDGKGVLVFKLGASFSLGGPAMRATLRRDGTVIDDFIFKADDVPCWTSLSSTQTQTDCMAQYIAQHEEGLAALAPPPATVAASAPRLSGKLAVLDLRLQTKDLRETDARYFTDLIRGAVLRLEPQLEVMTRENLLVLLQSTGKDLASCEGECEVDTGRRIGADEIISGELVKVGTRFKLSMRLHETHEGRLLGAAVASGSSVDQLDDSTNKAVAQLLGHTP